MKSFLSVALTLLLAPVVGAQNFNRVATYNVCRQLEPNCNVDDETVAEIVVATDDGMTLVYTDAALEAIGMVDITDPANPMGMGTVDLGGEPTSVAVKDGYAMASINTSPDFVNVTGELIVIEMSSGTVVATLDLGGQPDSIAISPDKTFAAVAIENERDEDLNDGVIPQLPAGSVAVIDISNADPTMWSLQQVDVTGLDGLLYNTDPEPEYVHINENNICVVTMQENNGLALIDLATNEVIGSFTAGSVDLDQIDILEEDVITLNGMQMARLREPDAVAWIGTENIATANEGDLDGGSRSWTIFDTQGAVVYEDGNKMDHATVRFGHYPEGRSENKGNEPEGILAATFGDTSYLFVSSERASVIMVYDVTDVTAPVFKQVLPTNVGPEGLAAIPERNLLIVSCEVDGRGDKIRAGLVIFELQEAEAQYPTIMSADRDDGTPIPFSALSGLAAGDSVIYAVEDSAYKMSRMFTIDPSQKPAVVTADTRISDADGVFAGALTGAGLDPTALINDDNTINIDPEGISVSHKGGFWLAHEGRGTVGDPDRPVESPNVLFKLSSAGVIEKVVLLPMEVNAIQLRFGFEGVAEDGDYVVVAFQRAWGSEANPRIGIYNQETMEWTFMFYPLDAVESQNGGWVGLSDIASLGCGKFLVLERDNQGGPDAAIKRIYQVDLGFSGMMDGGMMDMDGMTLEKTLFRDIYDDLAATNGNIYEKVEGLAVMSDGSVYVVNDNDGVDDNSGEQQFLLLDQMATLCDEPTMSSPTAAPNASPPTGTSGALGLASILIVSLVISVGMIVQD